MFTGLVSNTIFVVERDDIEIKLYQQYFNILKDG